MSEQNAMPTMPVLNNQESVSPSLSSPESSVAPSSEGVASLVVPNHEPTKFPEINKPGETSNDVKVPLVPKSGIEVVATRKGFYNQLRLREGDRFVVRNFEELGEWMECTDKVLEKQRLKMLQEKKARK